jgi:MYXO-CTERM domain-containing protein
LPQCDTASMRPAVVACVTAALLVPSTAAAAEYVNDPLTANSFPGRGSKGGTFSASGWTVTGEPDAVWYEIADALPSGRIEYTVTGLSLSSSLTGVDHDIFTMYQAPTGQAEPIAYSPYFRNNDFKTFQRIFGTQETGHPPGSMKIELAFCPRGEPWYHDEVCTASCDGSGIGYAGGSAQDIGWDASAAYRIAIEWGGGSLRYFRDQTELSSINYPGEFAPQPLRIRFGSPRHDGVYPGQAMMPIGITFRDVLVTGTPGSMTPICNAQAPDAGNDDSAVAPDAATQPGEVSVLADVTAASWESGVYPDTADLNAEADANGAPTGVVYLRFPAVAANGIVTHAVLKMHTQVNASAAGASGVVCPVADDTWSETTMTWATRPAMGSSCAGTSVSVDYDQNVEWDITALVKTGADLNVAIVSAEQNGVHYMSKEAGDVAKSPRLLFTVAPAADSGAAGSGGSGQGGSGGAGGVADAAAGGKSGAAGSSYHPSGGSAEGDDGCGCRSVGRSPGSPGLVLLALLGLARTRRR